MISVSLGQIEKSCRCLCWILRCLQAGSTGCRIALPCCGRPSMTEGVHHVHVQRSSHATLQLSRAAQPSRLGSRQTAGVPDEEVRGATESPAQSEAVNQAAQEISNEGSMPHSLIMHPQVRPLPRHTRHVEVSEADSSCMSSLTVQTTCFPLL